MSRLQRGLNGLTNAGGGSQRGSASGQSRMGGSSAGGMS